MSYIEYISIEEFREQGFLQEVNRKVLHPCGLALEVRTGPGGVELSEEEINLLRVIATDMVAADTWAFLRDIADRAANSPDRLGRVWDYRTDPEGMVYGEGYPTVEKAEAVAAEAEKHKEARLKMFGGGTSEERFIVQRADGSAAHE